MRPGAAQQRCCHCPSQPWLAPSLAHTVCQRPLMGARRCQVRNLMSPALSALLLSSLLTRSRTCYKLQSLLGSSCPWPRNTPGLLHSLRTTLSSAARLPQNSTQKPD